MPIKIQRSIILKDVNNYTVKYDFWEIGWLAPTYKAHPGFWARKSVKKVYGKKITVLDHQEDNRVYKT